MDTDVESPFDLDDDRERRARRLHEECIVIDGLVPATGYVPSETYRDHLRRGGVTAGNFTVASRVAYPAATERVQRFRRQIHRSGGAFSPCESVADVREVHDRGATGAILGFQDTMPVAPMDRMQTDDGTEFLRAFHAMGVRVVQLTYNSLNYVGAGCCERVDPGLSNFGRELVDELNRLGVLVDLSHCGDTTTTDAIEHSEDPVVFSHAGARALSNVERNKTDEQLRALADAGGVVGVTLFPPSVRTDPDTHEVQRATVEDVLDHVDHVVEVTGIDHVGFGSDMNDEALDEGVTPPYAAYRNFRPDHPEVYGRGPIEHYEPYPRGVHRHTKLLNLTRGLVDRGYDDEEVRKVLGGNFLRVFEEAWGS